MCENGIETAVRLDMYQIWVLVGILLLSYPVLSFPIGSINAAHHGRVSFIDGEIILVTNLIRSVSSGFKIKKTK